MKDNSLEMVPCLAVFKQTHHQKLIMLGALVIMNVIVQLEVTAFAESYDLYTTGISY